MKIQGGSPSRRPGATRPTAEASPPRATVPNRDHRTVPAERASAPRSVSGAGSACGEQGIGAVRAFQPAPPLAPVDVPKRIRIGLVVAQPSAAFSLPVASNAGGLLLEPNQTYRVSSAGAGRLELRDDSGQLLGTVAAPLAIETAEGAPVRLEGRRYRGNLDIMPTPGSPDTITVVDDVDLEAYLQGVLPAEMASGWPTEALRAQAVAARTYAASNVGRRSDQGFDLFPTVADQVYKGLEAEAADTTAAVQDTRGVVIRYQGALIDALFFASSGGHTDDAMAVWGMDLPYIKGVPDPDDSPNRQWTQTLTTSVVRTTLAGLGNDVGTPLSLTITERTPGGRARWMAVTGDRGTAVVDANRFRLAAGLKSTMIRLDQTKDGWIVTGAGYGHGLGMAQWGARSRAMAGASYRDILTTYYTGVTLDQPSPQTLGAHE